MSDQQRRQRQAAAIKAMIDSAGAPPTLEQIAAVASRASRRSALRAQGQALALPAQ